MTMKAWKLTAGSLALTAVLVVLITPCKRPRMASSAGRLLPAAFVTLTVTAVVYTAIASPAPS